MFELQRDVTVMPHRFGDPIDPRLPWIRKLHDLDVARASMGTGIRQGAVERAGRALGDLLREGPKVVSVRTLPTTDAPYPIRFAFNGTVPALAPGALLMIQNRSLLVQVRTADGLKNVLFNPTDGPANRATPFYQRLVGSVPGVPSAGPSSLRRIAAPSDSAELGLSCADIDVIAFDHFHTQDLRPLLGSDGLAARFPNALLLAPRVEWDDWDHLPMIQRALVRPRRQEGRTRQSRRPHPGRLVARRRRAPARARPVTLRATRRCSFMPMAACSAAPRTGPAPTTGPRTARDCRGMRSAAKLLDLEVVLNANTPELSAEQYTSMLLERAMVDRVKDDNGFYQMFPSSEVTHSLIAPHVKPTYRFGKVESGSVESRSRTANATPFRTAAAE